MPRDEKRVAVALLAQGLITPGEAVKLAGASRQLVHHWIKSYGIDWQRVRHARLVLLWRKERRYGAKLGKG
jgi:hypothetical protein